MMEQVSQYLLIAIWATRVLTALVVLGSGVALYFLARGLPELRAAWTDREEG